MVSPISMFSIPTTAQMFPASAVLTFLRPSLEEVQLLYTSLARFCVGAEDLNLFMLGACRRRYDRWQYDR